MYSKGALTSRRTAFTLIELLVVITIIGILISLVTVAVIPVQKKSRDARRKADVNSFLTGADLFKADFKIYPNSSFYLGTYGSAGNGGANSNLLIAEEIPDCNGLTNGKTSEFADLTSIFPETNPDDAQLNANPITVKPGFTAMNHFLICLRYIDHVLSDPKPATANPQDRYQYRVSFDYGDVIVTALLENSATDADAKVLFSDGSTIKRYYKGPGVVVRHLDDDSDAPVTGGGYFSQLTGNDADGQYLYQCKAQTDGTPISLDDRISYEPIVASGSAWAAGQCQNASGGLDVVAGY